MSQPKVTADMIDSFGKHLRPGQTINQIKLMELCQLPRDKFFAVKRELQRRGMLIEKLLRGKPTQYTFHNPPLPAEQRQTPVTRNKRTKAELNDLIDFKTTTIKTYTITSGQYTATQLEDLAKDVLKTLGK